MMDQARSSDEGLTEAACAGVGRVLDLLERNGAK
jgi:hypothetical protein